MLSQLLHVECQGYPPASALRCLCNQLADRLSRLSQQQGVLHADTQLQLTGCKGAASDSYNPPTARSSFSSDARTAGPGVLNHSYGRSLQQHQQRPPLLSFDTSRSQQLQQQPHQQQMQQHRHLHLAPPFLVEDYTPAAVTTYHLGRMPAKLQAAEEELEDCRVCPRKCGVNRWDF